MGHLKKILCISVCLTVLLFSAGCGQTGQSAEKGTGNAYAAITDDAGQTVVLQEKPQRVVVLSGSLLHLRLPLTATLSAGFLSIPMIRLFQKSIKRQPKSVPSIRSARRRRSLCSRIWSLPLKANMTRLPGYSKPTVFPYCFYRQKAMMT